MSTRHLPNINQRERIPATAIDDVVRQIIEKFDPRKIILFGSYARQEPKTTSDVDLLVIMETAVPETEQAVQILHTIEYHFGLDLLIRTPKNLAHRLALGDPFLQDIMSEGIVIYERIDR